MFSIKIICIVSFPDNIALYKGSFMNGVVAFNHLKYIIRNFIVVSCLAQVLTGHLFRMGP